MVVQQERLTEASPNDVWEGLTFATWCYLFRFCRAFSKTPECTFVYGRLPQKKNQILPSSTCSAQTNQDLRRAVPCWTLFHELHGW